MVFEWIDNARTESRLSPSWNVDVGPATIKEKASESRIGSTWRQFNLYTCTSRSPRRQTRSASNSINYSGHEKRTTFPRPPFFPSVAGFPCRTKSRSFSFSGLFPLFPQSQSLLSTFLPPFVASLIPSEAERRRIKRDGAREEAAMIRFLLIDPEDGKRSVVFWGAWLGNNRDIHRTYDLNGCVSDSSGGKGWPSCVQSQGGRRGRGLRHWGARETTSTEPVHCIAIILEVPCIKSECADAGRGMVKSGGGLTI